MKIKPIILFFILAGIVATGSFPNSPGKSKKYPSLYRDNIIVDGNAAEWPLSSFMTNKDAFLVFAVANDSANFYICIKIKDEQEQMRVMRSGMELWIDVKGKKKKETGIRFPLNHTLPPDHRNMAGEEKPDPKKMRLLFLVQLKDMELQGFKDGCDGRQNNKTNKSGIIGIINWDSTNTMVYEARIPFRTLNTDVATLDHVSFGMIMKSLTKPVVAGEGRQEDQGNPNDRDGMGGMGGQHSHGSLHQEGDRYGLDDHYRLYEDVDAWTEAGIAKK